MWHNGRLTTLEERLAHSLFLFMVMRLHIAVQIWRSSQPSPCNRHSYTSGKAWIESKFSVRFEMWFWKKCFLGVLLVIQSGLIGSGPAWTNTFLFFIVSSDKAAGTGGIDSVQRNLVYFSPYSKEIMWVNKHPNSIFPYMVYQYIKRGIQRNLIILKCHLQNLLVDHTLRALNWGHATAYFEKGGLVNESGFAGRKAFPRTCAAGWLSAGAPCTKKPAEAHNDLCVDRGQGWLAMDCLYMGNMETLLEMWFHLPPVLCVQIG